MEDDGEVCVEQREDCPRKRELRGRRIVVLDRCMDREWNVLNHDHEISDCQSREDSVRRAEHFLPGTKNSVDETGQQETRAPEHTKELK